MYKFILKMFFVAIFLTSLPLYLFAEDVKDETHAGIEGGDTIPFYSLDGKQRMDMSKEEYRKNILSKDIKIYWNKPGQLYSLIVMAVQDGLAPDVIKAAEHLLTIDKDSERSNVICAIVLAETGNPDKAEQILNGYVQRHGETGVVLTNLAKIYINRKQDQKSEETLWRGLTLDPNQENGMMWYVAMQNDRTGKEGYINALKRISELKGSWRAQLYLARECLEKKDLADAEKYYAKILAIASNEPDALTVISGDLGSNGYAQEMVNLIGRIYDSKKHGPDPAINLILAYINLGEFDKAKNLINKLKSFYRPDIQQRVEYFEDQLKLLKEKARA